MIPQFVCIARTNTPGLKKAHIVGLARGTSIPSVAPNAKDFIVLLGMLFNLVVNVEKKLLVVELSSGVLRRD